MMKAATHSAAPQRGRRARGFTIIEVLVAVVITAIGFAAIFSLQIGSMQGNIEAREMAAATNLAERFVAELRSDAYMWTTGLRPKADITPRLARTASVWHSFTETPVDQNGRANISEDPAFGSPLARQRFCVHYWLGERDPRMDGILRVQVRVIWPVASLDRSRLNTVCSEQQADDFAPDPSVYRTISLPAAVRRHASS
ncbi:MAG: prepilin-type N-terminal cleavage/methylation domain-containing protein [Bradymonadia bacterium]|jgi:prepilin-type N-terminal cleavage/methylation domain-containing protein